MTNSQRKLFTADFKHTWLTSYNIVHCLVRRTCL